ncbi:hypothetical protein PAHAL_4G222100 [Panicum hallii]|uniref:Uncharacterized protein n=1 Tax=Panicum hallii TaxID=206008 RepID=A0A2T8JDN8_9POAL|nr:hypothetical protein PAHAL_4G222100 [Panicum hallii]
MQKDTEVMGWCSQKGNGEFRLCTISFIFSFMYRLQTRQRAIRPYLYIHSLSAMECDMMLLVDVFMFVRMFLLNIYMI